MWIAWPLLAMTLLPLDRTKYQPKMSIPHAEADRLIQRVRAGSDSALGTLLNGYREYLLRIASDRIESGLAHNFAFAGVAPGLDDPRRSPSQAGKLVTH